MERQLFMFVFFLCFLHLKNGIWLVALLRKFWRIKVSQKLSTICIKWYEPASISRTRQCGTSDNLDATTDPPEPPPITIKSYSLSGKDRVYDKTRNVDINNRKMQFDIHLLTLGRLHGSSKSHWERRNTSSKPMNSINCPPPHVDANVGPIGAPTGQSQRAIVCKINRIKLIIIKLWNLYIKLSNTIRFEYFSELVAARRCWAPFWNWLKRFMW